MADIFGATAAATAIIGQSLNLIRRVTSTIKHYKNHDSRLECIYNDLSGIIEIIELVDNLEPLRTTGVSNAVTNMLEHAEKLDLHVQSLKKKHSTRSPARQMMNQLMDGAQDLEDTKKMVGELTTLKATLILEIQVVHIRLFVESGQAQQNDSGCTYVLDSLFLHHVNQAVEQKLGKGKGLRIAEVLQSKKPDDDGMIRLTKEEYECLASHPLGEDEANSQRGTIRVSENTCTDHAFQVNGPMGDSKSEITHDQTIERNAAHGQSMQFNGTMGANALDKALASRNMGLQSQSTGNPGQWQQPRSMPQQLVNRPRQARSCSPRSNYGRPGAIKRPKPLSNGTRGALPGLRQVTMAERQVSVVLSQAREDDDDGTRDRILASLDDTPCNKDERAS